MSRPPQDTDAWTRVFDLRDAVSASIIDAGSGSHIDAIKSYDKRLQGIPPELKRYVPEDHRISRRTLSRLWSNLSSYMVQPPAHKAGLGAYLALRLMSAACHETHEGLDKCIRIVRKHQLRKAGSPAETTHDLLTRLRGVMTVLWPSMLDPADTAPLTYTLAYLRQQEAAFQASGADEGLGGLHGADWRAMGRNVPAQAGPTQDAPTQANPPEHWAPSVYASVLIKKARISARHLQDKVRTFRALLTAAVLSHVGQGSLEHRRAMKRVLAEWDGHVRAVRDVVMAATQGKVADGTHDLPAMQLTVEARRDILEQHQAARAVQPDTVLTRLAQDGVTNLIYGLKLLRLVVQLTALAVVQRAYAQEHASRVVGMAAEAPKLTRMLFMFLGVDACLQTLTLLVLVLILMVNRQTHQHDGAVLQRFVIDEWFIQAFLVEYCVTTALLVAVGLPLSGFMQHKRYFMVHMDGEGVSKAYRDILGGVCCVLCVLPFHALF